MSEKRATVGAISSQLLASQPPTRNAVEIEQARQEAYINCMIDFIEKLRPKYRTDFYIEVQMRGERLMSNVFRNQFFDRVSCPSPMHDAIVYKYHYNADDLEYLWNVPDKETCRYLKTYRLLLPEEEKHLLKNVLDFEDGTLLRQAKRLNGEESESPLVEK